jgi:glycosyltransferase involved in cell wall biosynthesis
MNKLRLSVAMCTYNGARFLPEQLESIAVQMRLPDELVVCDDRSGDESIGIVKNFAKNAPFPVRLEINEKNLGSIKNFEKGIGLCRGEIIALADQDDVWKPQKLAALESVLEEHPEAGYVFSDAELINERGAPIRTTLWNSIRFRGAVLSNFSKTRQVETLLRRNAATGATMIFRSCLKNVLLPISPYFVHDYWIALLSSCLGAYGVPVPEPLIQYRQHTDQQIGAIRMSILQKVKWARQVGAVEYSNRAGGYLDMRERLLLTAQNGRTCRPNHMALLEEKIRHSTRRAAMHSTCGTAKISAVFSEVLTGRYARFSNSWISVVEDLCF